MEEKIKTGRKTLTGLVLLTAMGLPLACNDGCASYHGSGLRYNQKPAQENIKLVYENPVVNYRI